MDITEIRYFGTGKKYYFRGGRYLGWAYPGSDGYYTDAVPGESPGEEVDGREQEPETGFWPLS